MERCGVRFSFMSVIPTHPTSHKSHYSIRYLSSYHPHFTLYIVAPSKLDPLEMPMHRTDIPTQKEVETFLVERKKQELLALYL